MTINREREREREREIDEYYKITNNEYAHRAGHPPVTIKSQIVILKVKHNTNNFVTELCQQKYTSRKQNWYNLVLNLEFLILPP